MECEINDLGDEYEFANYVDMGDGRYIMELIFNGENIAGVCICEVKGRG